MIAIIQSASVRSWIGKGEPVSSVRIGRCRRIPYLLEANTAESRNRRGAEAEEANRDTNAIIERNRIPFKTWCLSIALNLYTDAYLRCVPYSLRTRVLRRDREPPQEDLKPEQSLALTSPRSDQLEYAKKNAEPFSTKWIKFKAALPVRSMFFVTRLSNVNTPVNDF